MHPSRVAGPNRALVSRCRQETDGLLGEKRGKKSMPKKARVYASHPSLPPSIIPSSMVGGKRKREAVAVFRGRISGLWLQIRVMQFLCAISK